MKANQSVDITSTGIKKVLRNYNAKQALSEYIWNGFDARATCIQLNYSANAFGSIENIEVIDNGYGIDFEKLPTKFKPFYESEKAIKISAPKHTSTMHGKNGVGRLTFFTFAHSANWLTTFRRNDTLISGSINIEIAGLNTYKENLLDTAVSNETGTKVTFYNVQLSEKDIEKIIPFLVVEFCWFLELNKSKGYKILINGIPLDYSNNIENQEEDIEIIYNEKNVTFDIKYIQWKAPLHKEFSKFYFLNNKNEEVYKDYTTFNNKGDEFYHSLYINSSFFDAFDFKSAEKKNQANIFGKAKSSAEYRFLIKKINEFLKQKRKPVLVESALKLVDQYEEDDILPTYENEWEEKYRKAQLVETIKSMYEVQPSLFSNLNVEQKKTFIRFLDLLLDSNERESIFKILDGIIEIEPTKRKELADLFKTTRLNCVIDTIKLIQDRFETCYKLQDLVFNPDLKADEVHHLQKLIESHYWFFGEQFHLVTAAEPKFDKALKRYHYLLYNEDVDHKIIHPDKYKEMDIFACRQNKKIDSIENIVIELKHPNINIGRNQYIQVDKYLQVILSEPIFNASNMSWEFYLVGKDYDQSGFIERLIESNASHGLRSLIHWSDKGRIKVFAKRWSEVFTEFEIKHKHLDEKLQLEREKLFNTLDTASEVVESVTNNSAVQPKEVSIVDEK